MDTSHNTVLITGGNSGIGLELARKLLAAGNTVIIAGKRADALEKAVSDNPGLQSCVVDMADARSIETMAAAVIRSHPTLNVLVNNAGVMRPENLTTDRVDLADAEAQITVNLLGPIRLTAALLPHLRRQAASTIINVTSGLAFVPLHQVPTYCATKAALHSYSESLRHQLRETSVRVLELAPPAVATNLMPLDESAPPTMPVTDFVDEVLEILTQHPNAVEILVDQVKPLRSAEASGQYSAIYAMLNG